jgi:FtsZ-interacting cell division protein ZipA
MLLELLIVIYKSTFIYGSKNLVLVMHKQKKWLTQLIVICVLATALLAVKWWQNRNNGSTASKVKYAPDKQQTYSPKQQEKTSNDRNNPNNNSHQSNNKGSFTNKEADVNRHPSRIHFSKHAKCRMSCRQFTESEVIEILEHGEINYRKSNDRPEKCPTYALEGKTHDGQTARMVFAFCDGGQEVTVVTVIDLDTDWTCDCY